MTNWEVSIVNTQKPFDLKSVHVNSETIQEALEIAEKEHDGYYARSARFHHTDLSKEFGYGYGPISAENHSTANGIG